MQLILESDRLEDYLKEIPGLINFSADFVQDKIKAIKEAADDDYTRAKLAFEYVRDDIGHSFDTKCEKVTISAEAAMSEKDGICFAKAHVLAALLRGMGIPAGFSYQRVVRQGTVESGYALHGLNSLYLKDIGWFRVDPRGNKPGIQSEFSTSEEKLAYPIREDLGEIDYPNVYTAPLNSVIESMESSENTQALFYNRPPSI